MGEQRENVASPDRLWTMPDGEVCYLDPVEVYEGEIDPYMEPTDVVDCTLYEYTVLPPIKHLPSVAGVLELIHERTCEYGEMDEGYCEHLEGILNKPEITALVRNLLEQIASKIGYRMCDEKVGEHHLTGTVEEGLFLDGERLTNPSVTDRGSEHG